MNYAFVKSIIKLLLIFWSLHLHKVSLFNNFAWSHNTKKSTKSVHPKVILYLNGIRNFTPITWKLFIISLSTVIQLWLCRIKHNTILQSWKLYASCVLLFTKTLMKTFMSKIPVEKWYLFKENICVTQPSTQVALNFSLKCILVYIQWIKERLD